MGQDFTITAQSRIKTKIQTLIESGDSDVDVECVGSN